MHIIADSGGTSISWALVERASGTAEVIETPGYNAVTSAEGRLGEIFDEFLRDKIPSAGKGGKIESVEFYGAGCGSAEACGRVEAQLRDRLGGDSELNVTVGSDMLGAARALLGRRRGVACILGTGSNSCLFDGGRIVANVPPLGYILGDEGSGAVLGRRLIGEVLKGTLDGGLIEAFREEYPGLSITDVIENVYRRPGANTYLASFAPFLSRHIDHPEAEGLVVDEFRRFFRHNVWQYGERKAGFVGSVAVHFRAQLEKAARAERFEVDGVMAGPLGALVKRHLEGE